MNLDLQNREWKAFKIENEFSVSTGANLSRQYLKEGNIPRITATDNNNGIFDFYQKSGHKNYREVSNFISVSFLGSVFYHPYTASLDMKIHAVKIPNIELNKYIAEFLVFCFKRMASIYSYGDQLSSKDLPKKKILLPVNSKGEPDYEFMEQYIKQKENKKIKEYISYIKNRIKKLENTPKPVPLHHEEWQEFEIGTLFNIKSGKRLTKAEMKSGEIPFIGATDSNNGITEFVSGTNNSESSNVLGVNYNGSVVENFYHPYKAIFSDDVKRLTFKTITGNKYLFLFVKTQILQQKGKYQYGYKFNAKRMKKQQIMLPVNKKGNPDYEYMENYIKQLEYKKLQKYLEIKNN